MNLLSNACKFTKDGFIQVDAWVTGPESKEDREVLERSKLFISVKDSGTGIPEKEVSRLFTDYSTLKFNAHLNPNGVGLGLSICKKICKLLGGDIAVESKVGHGSTFTFNVTADLFPGSRTEGCAEKQISSF
jgi:two-component system sensor histidine kinase/response regulator